MSASSAAWTRHVPDWDRKCADDYDLGDPTGPAEFDAKPEECAEHFQDMLIQLKCSGTLSAKQVCLLAYWAKGGGLDEVGSKLALPPGRSGGNYSRHFDHVLGFNKDLRENFYEVPLPQVERWTASRVVESCAANLVHAQLAEEICSTKDVDRKVSAAVEASGWAHEYRLHEHVRGAAGNCVVPLAIYTDGVAFQARDSAIGIWFTNLANDRRYLVLALRKSRLCACGCKGWCTLYNAWKFVAWLLGIMACGRYPPCRHDGTPWPVGDVNRDLAGQALGYTAAAVLVKADWAEFCSSVGFPTWAHTRHPCFKCFCTGGPDGSIRGTTGVSALSLPWREKGPTDYDTACAAAEVRVNIFNRTELQLLLGHLEYDKSSRGPGGRAVVADLPALRLERGDRLEPSASCPDVLALFCTSVPSLDSVRFRTSLC